MSSPVTNPKDLSSLKRGGSHIIPGKNVVATTIFPGNIVEYRVKAANVIP